MTTPAQASFARKIAAQETAKPPKAPKAPKAPTAAKSSRARKAAGK